MFDTIHLLRPWWALLLIPLVFFVLFYRHKKTKTAWETVCDQNLLPFLIDKNSTRSHNIALFFLVTAAFFMVVALTGPSWSRLPLPSFKKVLPRVVLLDLSETILNKDLAPDRLSRAKFILHDLFNRDDLGPIALIVYSSEPFVASPLTEDGKTIDTLLPMLTPSIMPVGGQNLEKALEEGRQLLHQAGFNQGQFLVLTGSAPDNQAIALAKKLSHEGIQTSLMPLVSHPRYLALFDPFVRASQGLNISITNPMKAITSWLAAGSNLQYALDLNQDIPLWKDEGVWFIFIALFFLLPVFRRQWLQRIET